MNPRYRALTGACLIAVLSVAPAMAQTYVEAWRTGGFKMPESVSYDPGTKTLFASNINSADMSANGQGYVTQLGLDGKVIKEQFVTGLNAPKGTYVSNGKLWVAGNGEVVEIDIASAKVANRYPAAGATFLNDPMVGGDGRVYVTETMQNAIYVIDNGKLTEWLTSPELGGANGLVARGDDLLVADLGDISKGFDKMKPSNVKVVSIKDKSIHDFGSADPIGSLDGIEAMGDGITVTDNPGGRLVSVDPHGRVTELAKPGPGAADHEYVKDQDLFIVPMTGAGELIGYKKGS